MDTTVIESTINDMTKQFLTPQNIGAAFAIWIILHVAARALPALFHKAAFKRALPFLPEALGIISMYIPGMAAKDATMSTRIFSGIVIGFAASKLHKVMRQSFLGVDDDITTPEVEEKKADEPKDGSVETDSTDAITKPETPTLKAEEKK